MKSKFQILKRTIAGVNSFISVDSGLNTSLALWTKYQNDYELTHIHAIKTPQKITGEQARINYITDQFNNIIVKWAKLYNSVDIIVIEGVSFWSDSDKSLVAAKTGSLTLLSYIVGGLITECKYLRIPCETILFNDWGGQMKPEMVKGRVQQIMHKVYKSQHTYDAVGMGLSLQGKFGR